MRITGPGPPFAGVVLGRSNALGTADYLQIQNKTGTLAYSFDNSNTASEFILGVANADKSPAAWQDKSNWAAAPLEDFAPIRLFSRYKFEVFRNVTDVTPKAEFYVRMTASPVAPAFGTALQWNTIGTASLGYLDPANTDKAAALSPAATFATQLCRESRFKTMTALSFRNTSNPPASTDHGTASCVSDRTALLKAR